MPAGDTAPEPDALQKLDGHIRAFAWRARWLLWMVIAVTTAVMSMRYVDDLAETTHEFGGTALSDYLEAGRRAFAGELYEINYSYPPVFAIAMHPFTWLPQGAAAVTWMILQFAALVACGVCAWKLLNSTKTPLLAAACVAALAAGFRFHNNNLVHGNINSFVLLSLLLATSDLARGRESRAGFWAAVAATAKVLPLFYLFIFAARRSWRACMAMMASLFLLNVAVPALVTGPERAAATARAFYHKMIEPFYSSSSLGVDPRNLALSAAIKEHFEAELPAESLPARKYNYDFQIAALSSPAVNTISKLVLAAIAALSIVSIARRARNRDDQPAESALYAAAVGLLCLLLISPKTWTAHYVWLFPAQLFLFLSVFQNWNERSVRARAVRATVIIATIILVFSSKGIVGSRGGAILRALSIETLAVLMLWTSLIFGRARIQISPQNLNIKNSAGASD